MVTTDETLAREILDRLTRLETLAVENNRQINERIDATNQQLANLSNRVDHLSERVDLLSERVTRVEERLDQLDKRLDRVEDRLERLEDRSTSRMDKLFYTMIGLGAAVIASLIAGQALD